MKTRVRVAALIQKEQKLLLVLHEKAGRQYYLFPGGGVEPGENEKQALIRECQEEVGLSVTPEKLLFSTKTTSPDHSRIVFQKLYLCRAKGVPHPSQDPRVVGAEFADPARFKTLVLFPDIKDRVLDAWGNDFRANSETFEVPWIP